MKFFDSHAHYNDEKFDKDREDLIKEVHEFGVEKLICAGYSLQSSKYALEIVNKYDWMYTISGISPNDISNSYEEIDEELKDLEDFIKTKDGNKKIVAIGEIGLDYHWNTENKELQKYAFIKQIELANELNLPIVIHTREAVMDTIQILKENNVVKKGVFHCCPLNRELVKEALKLGFYISFAGPITFKNSKNADEIIQMVPEDKILIETDSPYLSPEPNRGKRNDSRNLQFIAEKISTVKKVSVKEIENITFRNTCEIFGIK
mgnify:FL=1